MIGLFAATVGGRKAAAELAARLGSDAMLADGPVGPALRRLWPRLDSAVFFLAGDATVRLVAPLLRDSHTDPAVVCVDESRRFAIALVGGLSGEANALAEQVAEVLGVDPVVTTTADSAGSTALDEVADQLDATVDGDLAGCGVAILDGEPVRLVNPHGFPLPALPENVGHDINNPQWTVVVDDRRPLEQDSRQTLRLIPRTLVVGVGSSRGVSRTAVTELVARLDREYGLDPRALRTFATVDVKADEHGIIEAVQDMGFWHSVEGGDELPLRHYPAETLAGVQVPNPSGAALAEVGTSSVAEAAALHAARELGGRAELAVDKLVGDNVTVAAARVCPRGRLAIIGIGPGVPDLRTSRSEAELRRAAVVVGLEEHIDQVRHLLRSGTDVRASEPEGQRARAAEAVSLAESGLAVALIESGDTVPGLALERAGTGVEVVRVPGVTSDLEASALLGAPLGRDHALIGLADPDATWESIERRVRAAAEGDLVVCFSAPRPVDRDRQLGRALEILAEHRPPSTPVGAVSRVDQHEQRVWCAPIGEFDLAHVDTHTTVIAGSSQSTMAGGRMVTPR